MLEQLQAKVTEAGMGGRVSTWAVPCNMLFVEAGVEYAKKVLEGQTDGVLDDAVPVSYTPLNAKNLTKP